VLSVVPTPMVGNVPAGSVRHRQFVKALARDIFSRRGLNPFLYTFVTTDFNARARAVVALLLKPAFQAQTGDGPGGRHPLAFIIPDPCCRTFALGNGWFRPDFSVIKLDAVPARHDHRADQTARRPGPGTIISVTGSSMCGRRGVGVCFLTRFSLLAGAADISPELGTEAAAIGTGASPRGQSAFRATWTGSSCCPVEMVSAVFGDSRSFRFQMV